MEVLILTIFASAVLVAGALLFFAWNVRQGSHEHAERLALLPLDQPAEAPANAPSHVSPTSKEDSPSWK